MSRVRQLLAGLALTIPLAASAQFAEPVSWSHRVAGTETENVYEVVFTATIAAPWHMYDMGPYVGGPNPTVFTFEAAEGVQPEGPTVQLTAPRRIEDEIFGMEIGYFAGRALFARRLRVTSARPVSLRATVEYMVCDDQSCLPPTEVDFTLALPAARPIAGDSAAFAGAALAAAPEGTPAARPPGGTPAADTLNTPASAVAGIVPAPTGLGGRSLWGKLLEALLWGLAAFLTPCVFPMAPMTVSWFLKDGENKARGRLLASVYGLSIVALYTLPVLALAGATRLFGGEAVTAGLFNRVATHWLPNVLFFAVFMLFAASFFGAFELRMPGRWINRADAKVDRGGLAGVFFMALTLVLVSFSCTGPIVGSVLAASTGGGVWEPAFTMLAFSVAFALPFTVLAFFPALLKNLPRSGGWLATVKGVLGFVEIALGLKFLSIADQTYHWRLLDREVYLAIWIAVSFLLGLYLLGKIRFKHDPQVGTVGVPRLALAIAVFSFTVYLLPGLWGAPLKALSGYLPPMHTQDFVLGPTAVRPPADSTRTVKYGDLLHLPHGLSGYFDYEEGMAHGRAVGKPVFIDITGHGCVNCREMEARVWSDPRVLGLLRDRYVLIALYVDDRTRLPRNEWVTSPEGRVLKTLGQVNADFALRTFGTAAQPHYVLLDGAGRPLAAPRSYNLDIPAFVDFLEEGIANYNKQTR